MQKKRKPGRPRNERIHEIMRERKCSRTWAYVLWNRETEGERELLRKASPITLMTLMD